MRSTVQKSRRTSLTTATLKQHRAPLVIDLCCGMGGISLAAQQLKMRVIAGVDVDSAASRTFENNFPTAVAITGSVRSRSVIEECDMLIEQQRLPRQKTIVVSGPPCQGFSAAGSRDPNDPRNRVLLAVARSVVSLNPHCALIENVSRVLANDHSPRVNKLTRVFSDAGYHVTSAVLNAADYGVPQRRERAFFFVTKRRVKAKSLERKFQLLKVPEVCVADVLGDLPMPDPRPDTYIDEDDDSSLPNHFAMQHTKRVIAKIAKIPQGSGPMSYRKLHPARCSNTLISGHRAPPAHYDQPRSITVREAARIQGFPDAFRVYGPFANQMGQVTNAVPPPLARAALEVLCDLAGVDL